ncbi:hypothetical protein L6R52_29475 [Myxococcota bacterium]|nr:hypothetical protein [Myxococcota bacterium]
MAVGSSTDKPLTPPKPTVGQVASQAVKDFVGGALNGTDASSSIAATIGDIAASAIPVFGEQKALRDVYEGARSGDPAKLVGGLVGLIPVAGGAAKSLAAGGKKAAATASAQVAEKGVSAAALHFSKVAAESTRAAVKSAAQNPKLKAELAKAGERAYGRTMEILQDRLVGMAEQGKLPSLVTRDHGSFIDARKAAFSELGIERPDASWQSLFVDDAGKKKVVGKHQPVAETANVDELISALGFRFIEPEATKTGEKADYKLMWWKQPDAAADPAFGIESFSATPGEAQKIFDAYLAQQKSFRSTKKT